MSLVRPTTGYAGAHPICAGTYGARAVSVRLPPVPWLPWILVCVALAVIGIAVLGALATRVLVAVRELGRELERSQERLEPKLAAFEEMSQRRAGEHERQTNFP